MGRISALCIKGINLYEQKSEQSKLFTKQQVIFILIFLPFLWPLLKSCIIQTRQTECYKCFPSTPCTSTPGRVERYLEPLLCHLPRTEMAHFLCGCGLHLASVLLLGSCCRLRCALATHFEKTNGYQITENPTSQKEVWPNFVLFILLKITYVKILLLPFCFQ